jgi:hypothetical protein
MPRVHLEVLFKCETHASEYALGVLLRRHSCSYVDEGNYQSMPLAWVAAERVF